MEFQLRQIGKKKIYREILEEIWQSIQRYDLKPGDKLPTEAYLAKQLKIARPTLREALSVLDYVGILESVQGGGYYVKSVTPVQPSFLLSRNGKSISPYELVVARLMVEPEICRLAARQRKENDLANLARILETMRQKVEQGAIPTREDNAFHLGVAQAAANMILRSMVETLMSLKEQVLYEAIEVTAYRHNPKLNDMQLEHEKIFAAIKNRKADQAREAMRYHLLRIKKDLYRGP
jgi:GntR family transcriptional regulator, transcriptional repressor for pyruvate dehydrogenase complex